MVSIKKVGTFLDSFYKVLMAIFSLIKLTKKVKDKTRLAI